MYELINAQNWILMLETIILLIAPKERIRIYYLLALFSVIIFFFV